MNKNLLIFAVIGVLVLGVGFTITRDEKGALTTPGIGSADKKISSTPEPTVAPPNAPKTFQYDSSTDLEAELDQIDPQIIDSDFE